MQKQEHFILGEMEQGVAHSVTEDEIKFIRRSIANESIANYSESLFM